MNNSKTSIKRVYFMFLLLFILIIGYILKLTFVDGKTMITSAYNPRLNITDDSIKRGNIYGIDGAILAYSEKVGNTYVRYYNNGQYSAHVLGYTGIGKAGTEATQNFILQKIDAETFQRIKSFISGSEIEGNSVVLTIDSSLQKIATDLLGSNNGAVVVIEVGTGRVLSMVSKPNYNPQIVAENWEQLRTDENSPLLNRATKGIYAPGSTFKIVTALTAIRNMLNVESFTYECTGTAYHENKVMNCHSKTAHGSVDINTAFAKSCNGYFAELAKTLGNEKLIETAKSLGFNSSMPFELETSVSSVLLTQKSTESELVETSIGQGKTTVTPLFMASLVSAIGNEGLQMQPYILDHTKDYSGNIISQTLPKPMRSLFTPDETKKLTEMMVQVVNSGTGANANSEYFQVAGKTGTAENPHGSDHLWFVGFAPAESSEYAVAVVLENADGSANPSVIARKMLYNSIYREDN